MTGPVPEDGQPVTDDEDEARARTELDDAAAAAGETWAAKNTTKQASDGSLKDWEWLGMGGQA
jgi:hypothetical protein